MTWNWQRPDWPRFRFDEAALRPLEAQFLTQGGIVIGAARHISASERHQLAVEIMSSEAQKTAEIEGEMLDRDSLQSSIQRQFGLKTDQRRVSPAEQGIAEMMVELYRGFDTALDHDLLFRWHGLLMQGRTDLHDIGAYRTHAEAMQIVSGPVYDPNVHFEAPPSAQVRKEMEAFCTWFEARKPNGPAPLPTLARAGIAHLYFESIHPFEDGNGRIGRAIAEMALAQGLGEPSLTALSLTIERRRKAYYAALEQAHRDNEVTEWLQWFADTVLEAQRHTQRWIDFLIEKAKYFDRLRGQLNERQEKALLRVTREGPGGFTGGLSARNYVTITGTTTATATRDLAQLVKIEALIRTGQLKGTRYWLPFADETTEQS